MPKWTAEQEQVIASRGQTLLVAAAAGSGKTAVLVERILSLLREGGDVRRLLVLTFTRMAAAEMRERLHAALSAAQDEGMRAQAAFLDEARIGTLHSFCTALLRERFADAGGDPGFAVADAGEMDVLLRQSAQDAVDELLAQDAPDVRALELLMPGMDALTERIVQLCLFAWADTDPARWLAGAPDALAGEDEALGDAPWANSLAADVRRELARCRPAMRGSLQRLSDAGCADAADLVRDNLRQLEAALLAADQGLAALCAALADFQHGTWSARKGDKDAAAREKPVREAWKTRIDGLREPFLDGFSALCRDVRAAAPAVRALCGLSLRAAALYRRRKEARGVKDFSDLEHDALALLSQPGVAEAVRRGFDAVFVDEYQDTSRIQEAILQLVSRGDNLFLVGDVKQSIYRFRQADPQLFLQRHRAFSQEADAPQRRIDLSRNFRSQSSVLDAVNALFSALMTGEEGEIDYSDGHALTAGLPSQEGGESVLIHLLNTGAPGEDEDEAEAAEEDGPEALDPREDGPAEARAVALRALALRGTPYYDPRLGAERPLAFSDMAVLMRSPGPRSADFARALSQAGVPCFADGGGALARPDVRMALALLRCVDNPRRDDALITTLHAPFMGFTAQDLARIRAFTPDGRVPFYDAARRAARVDDDLGARLTSFFGLIDELAQTARQLPCGEAVWRTLTDSGLYDAAAALARGEEAQQNMRALVERAMRFAQTPRASLCDFLRHVEKLARGGGDEAEASAPGELDAVRLLSIHKSKGLEYPVVFLCDTARRFNLRSAREMPLHRDLGVGLRGAFPETHETCDTAHRRAIAARLIEEQRCEEMRLLYVAMTRARARLEVFASLPDPAKRLARLQDGAAANSFIDWLCGAAQENPALFRLSFPSVDSAAPKDLSPAPDAAAQERGWLQERLSFRYPHAQARGLPRKMSVTGLAQPGLPPLASRPRFLAPLRPAAADRGTATHLLLRRLQLDAVRNCPDGGLEALLSSALAGSVAAGMPRETADAVDVPALARFLRGPLGARMLASPRVVREAPFELLLPAREVDPAAGSEEPILLQGVVDLCFLEADAWVLVDFKTDRLSAREAEATADARHGRQVRLYARALRQLTGLAVAHCYVAFLSPGVNVELA